MATCMYIHVWQLIFNFMPITFMKITQPQIPTCKASAKTVKHQCKRSVTWWARVNRLPYYRGSCKTVSRRGPFVWALDNHCSSKATVLRRYAITPTHSQVSEILECVTNFSIITTNISELCNSIVQVADEMHPCTSYTINEISTMPFLCWASVIAYMTRTLY